MQFLRSPLLDSGFFSSNGESRLRLLLALLAAIGALLVGELVFYNEYITTDEHSYIFQAWLFLQGELRLTCPPLSEAFFHRMIICDDQIGWVSRYPPAHSVWLIPGVAVGYPRLMSAVAAFVSFWFLSKAAERLDIPVWLIGLLLFLSPYFWLMQGSVLSHTSGLAATSLMIWAYLVWNQQHKINYAVIAGLAWAFLFLGRSYTALWIALPFGIHALGVLAANRQQSNIWYGTLTFAATAGSGVGLYLLYNFLITGDALLSPFLYYDATEGPGFGLRSGRLFTPEMGWSYLLHNLRQLDLNLWGFSGSLGLCLGLSLIGWRKPFTPLFLSSALLVWLAYTAFWFIGIAEIQPVYYYETLPFLILGAAMGIQRLRGLSIILPLWSRLILILVLAWFIPQAAWNTFKTNAELAQKRSSLIHGMQKAIDDAPDNAIVLLRGVHKWNLQNNSWNPEGLQSTPLVMRDVHGVSLLLPEIFPDRPVYLLTGLPPVTAQKQSAESLRLRTVYARNTRARTGEINKTAVPASYLAYAPKHAGGLLSYGTSQYMLRGIYELVFSINASGLPGDKIGRIELQDTESGRVLASQPIHDGDTRISFKLDISETQIIEAKLVYTGKGSLEFFKIEIRMLSKDPAALIAAKHTMNGLAPRLD